MRRNLANQVGHRTIIGNRIAWVVGSFVTASVLVSSSGCGSSDAPVNQPSARDTAAGTVCDYASRCGNVGDGKMYQTRDACLTTWKGNIEQLWPPAECPRIQQANFDTCVASIKIGTCENGLDVLAILSKCRKEQICASP